MNTEHMDKARDEFMATIPKEVIESGGGVLKTMAEAAFETGWIKCAKAVMHSL